MEWTDDLSLRVARGESLVSLTDYLLERAQRPWPEIRDVLVERFALSYDDARLAWDRARGGTVRAATAAPANEPDRIKDPVAWIAYQRARGRAVDTPAPVERRQAQADALIAKAFAEGRMLGANDVEVALEVARIAMARSAASEPDAKNLLILAATAVSTAIEAQLEARGVERCAPEGAQAWIDGSALAAASRQLAQQFAARGWRDLEQRALGLRGRVVTGLLGQCRARVGSAMLDQIRGARATGDDALAAELCEAVVQDFQAVVEAWEATADVPFDEHHLALEHLLAALDELAEIAELTADQASLRARCATLLARSAAAG